jgi:two-component system chemotaxis response regulator CheY
MDANRNLNIFIVDEDKESRLRYKDILAGLGFNNIIEVNCADECFKIISNQPDVVILDQGHNPKDGIETLKKIKATNPDIYVVFVTDKEHLQIPDSAQNHGAFDYLYKGYKEESMLNMVMQKILYVKEMIVKRPTKTEFSFYNL